MLMAILTIIKLIGKRRIEHEMEWYHEELAALELTQLDGAGARRGGRPIHRARRGGRPIHRALTSHFNKQTHHRRPTDVSRPSASRLLASSAPPNPYSTAANYIPTPGWHPFFLPTTRPCSRSAGAIFLFVLRCWQTDSMSRVKLCQCPSHWK